MSTVRRRRLVAFTVSFVSLVAWCARLGAQPLPQAGVPPPHVRPSLDLRRLVAQASQHSDVIRSLIAEIEAADVTVYIRTRPLLPNLQGRTGLLAVHGGRRYLVIELACGESALVQTAILAHELFHVVEIAREPSVVDSRTLAAFYERIGIEASGSPWRRMFETDEAVDAGRRARRQLLTRTRSTDGT